MCTKSFRKTDVISLTHEELHTQYGDVELKFLSYRRHMFCYMADLNDSTVLLCEYGGDADIIYGHVVLSSDKITVNALKPHKGQLYKTNMVAINND